MKQLLLGTLLLMSAAGAASAADTSSLNLAQARAIAAKAETAIAAHHIGGAIAIVDPAGNLVLFERLDGATLANLRLAPKKALAAAEFGVPTQNFADRLAKGDVTVLASSEILALPGGLPIKRNGKLVGAIGISTPVGALDAVVAAAALTK
ncbi:heme-binding protein [Thioclava sp. BHET1]|nr:heme-binding protein [Thioclava sp. BHET1]